MSGFYGGSNNQKSLYFMYQQYKEAQYVNKGN